MTQLRYPFFLEGDDVCQKSLIVNEIKYNMKIKKEETIFIQVEDKSNYLCGSLEQCYPCYVENVWMVRR